MLKNLSPTSKLVGGLIVFVLIVMVIMISVSGNKVPQQNNQTHFINDNASADTKVEALKTMTADLLAVENKNTQLEKVVDDLKTQNQLSVSKMQQTVATQVQQALQQLQSQNEQKQDAFESSLKQKTQDNASSYPVEGGNDTNDAASNDANNNFVWVSDMSQHSIINSESNTGHSLPLTNRQIEKLINTSNHLADNPTKPTTDSLLHPNEDIKTSFSHSSFSDKQPIKPMYTIPVNATLTGATLMTPLVGRVPIDGKLPSPYSFKLVLSANNLTANGYPLPGVKGAVLSGIASGDMLGSCARGDIQSITFVFNDGTISTTQAQGQNGETSLGYLSSETGNPCIDGKFHSNAAVFLGAQMGLAGAQGYANAISSSQYMNSVTAQGNAMSTLVGSANRAGVGAGGSAAAQAAQTWWNQRVQDSFDYVYVPNIDSQTGKPMKVVVNISQEIPVDYNKNARKVDYENDQSLINSQLD